jgi:hypothetical protein
MRTTFGGKVRDKKEHAGILFKISWYDVTHTTSGSKNHKEKLENISR